MTLPKIKTVNVVTMKHGREFAEGWFRVSIDDSCDDTGILKWPGDDDADPSDDATERFHELTNDICRRVYDSTKGQIAEAFVRIANAAIDEERTRPEEPLVSPRVEMVEEVTREHGEVFADWWEDASRSSGSLTEASAEAHIMTWPDDDERGQAEYHAIEHEIARRVFDELRSAIIDTYVRIANEVLTRERRNLVPAEEDVEE